MRNACTAYHISIELQRQILSQPTGPDVVYCRFDLRNQDHGPLHEGNRFFHPRWDGSLRGTVDGRKSHQKIEDTKLRSVDVLETRIAP